METIFFVIAVTLAFGLLALAATRWGADSRDQSTRVSI
jgi:nitrogen fixation-related uncharacterized protein